MRSPHLPLLASAAIAACTAAACDDTPTEPWVRGAEPQGIAPTTASVKRLTRAQYTAAVHDLLGDGIAVPTNLEPDVQSHHSAALGASIASVSALGVERYEAAAYDIAAQAMEPGAARDALIPCTPEGTVDASCSEAFVAALGRRAFRRPLSSEEVSRYAALANTAAENLDDFHDGLEFAIAGLLQSPSFLFRIELGDDGAYDDHEMATRLSFFLWNTIPDQELMEAADAGRLTNPDTLAAEIDRMLASPRARDGVRAFFADRFLLGRLDDLVKDSTVFTSMSAELGAYAREETLLGIEDLVFEQRGDYRDLFTTRRTFLNRKLAALYRVPAPDLDGFALTYLPADGPRAGLLGQASVLAAHSHATTTSATLRGIFVRQVVLCGPIPPPPAEVDTSLPEPSQVMPTLRDRIGDHLTAPLCASCHLQLDPIGLGLERFDGIGAFRFTENDHPIDPSGDLDGVPFSDARSLGEAVANHPDLGPCLAEHMLRYAVGAEVSDEQEPVVEWLAHELEGDGHRILPLMRRIALSDAFRRATPGEPPDPSMPQKDKL